MASNLINKYVWLVDTIHRAKLISLKEINRRWLDDDLSEGLEIPERTFHKWRIAIEDLFGLVIENEKRGEYRYYILNDEELSVGGLRTWLLNTFSVGNLLINSQSLKDRILLENVPSGRQFLPVILEAMKESKPLRITYQSYWNDRAHRSKVEPYCVKLFKQRWYMVARNPREGMVRIYALDRIQDIHKQEDMTFAMPEDFSAEELFESCYGIIACDGTRVENVKLKVSGNQAKYFRSLPLHSSQRETFTCRNYSVFEYDVRPTFDFQQEILSHTPDVEVLAPPSLRQEIAWKIGFMNEIYHKKIRKKCEKS